MNTYKVTCKYTQAKFIGKQAIPANDSLTYYETTIRAYSEKAIFPLLLTEIQQKTKLKYVKIIDIHHELL